MAFCWRADDGPTLNVGLVFHRFWTGIAKKKLYFCDFSVGSGLPVFPLWIRPWVNAATFTITPGACFKLKVMERTLLFESNLFFKYQRPDYFLAINWAISSACGCPHITISMSMHQIMNVAIAC